MFISDLSLLKTIWIWKQSHTVCIWSTAGLQSTLTQELKAQIMKMTQSSEWVQKDLPFTQSLGDFPSLIVFTSHELSMRSARTGLLPSWLKTLVGRRQKLFPKPLTWNQASDLHPQPEEDTRRVPNFTILFLSLPALPCQHWFFADKHTTGDQLISIWSQPSYPQYWWWEAS